jgi:hypothetical protein
MNPKPFQINGDISRAKTLPAAMYVDPACTIAAAYLPGIEMETLLPNPANLPFGETHEFSATSFALILRIGAVFNPRPALYSILN